MLKKLLVISFIFSFLLLACDDDTNSTNSPVCGDNVIDIETGEECDGATAPPTLAAINAICGEGVSMLSCSSNCTIVCDSCGNGVIDATGNEQCDGSNLGTASCDNEGYYPGTLGCNDDCTFNYDDCGGTCGDSLIQNGAGEDCDGNNLGVINCVDHTTPQNYHGGTLSCATDCQYNTNNCEYCGDGTINGTEVCDGSSASCIDLNYFTGTSTCSTSCTISGCTNFVQWGSTEYEMSKGVAIDLLGSIYITGNTSGAFYGANQGGNDLFLTKYSWEGILQWNRQWGTSENDYGNGLVIDSANNIYVTGYTFGSLDGTLIGGRDFFLSKFNSDGTLLWNKQWGTPQLDEAHGLAIDSSDNIYVTGLTGGVLDVTNHGSYDMTLTKFNSNGVIQWNRQWGGTASDSGLKIAIDPSGDLLISGKTYGTLAIPHLGFNDAVLTKYSSDGTHLWDRQWGTDQSEYGYDIVLDSVGNIYVAGDTYGSLDGTNLGSTDLFLTKFNSDGTHLWDKQWGTTGPEYFGGLTIDSNDFLYISGGSEGALGGVHEGESDLILTKYSSDGTHLWNKQWGTSESDSGDDIAIDSWDNLFITGFTDGVLDGTNLGSIDLYLLKTTTNP
jgi:Beta-propeller repeat